MTKGLEATRTERKTVSSLSRAPPGLDMIMTKTASANFFRGQRGSSFDHGLTRGPVTTHHVKPQLIESKVSERDEFYNLSDGFKRIFADDKQDRKIVIPVVGYGGHRRGDRSQNYFGKSFRDTTIQSKCLERNLRSRSHAQ